jgi:hypothetical protein
MFGMARRPRTNNCPPPKHILLDGGRVFFMITFFPIYSFVVQADSRRIARIKARSPALYLLEALYQGFKTSGAGIVFVGFDMDVHFDVLPNIAMPDAHVMEQTISV